MMATSWFKSKSSFSYEALSCGQIRLVTINSGSVTQRVTCSIQNVPLCESIPVYSAISYTWGNSTKSKTILCDGPGSNGPLSLMVTANLEVAMRYIRQKAKPITVWIDQLCINQEDAEERESQVKMMGLIYRYAAEVLIWLGVEADDSSSALALVEQSSDPEVLRKIWQEDKGPKTPGEFRAPKWDHPDWQALGALLRRPWFERVWVIQEVAMSSKTRVICGKASVSWETLAAVISAVEFETTRPSAASNTIHGSPAQRVRFMNDLRKAQNQDPQRTDLFQFLILAKSCKSTDPRDKIYAFLGLANFGIVPKYSEDVDAETPSLYISFAINYVTKALTQSLNSQADRECQARKVMSIIYTAGRANQKLLLPSWVPDWSIEFQSRPLWTGPSWAAAQEGQTGAGGREFGSCLPRIIAGRYLRLPGKLFDHVRFAGSVKLDLEQRLTPTELYTSATAWFNEAKHIDVLRGDMHRRKEHEDEVFKRTVAANRGRYCDFCSMEDLQSAYNGWRRLIDTPWRKQVFKNKDEDKKRSGARWLYHNATMAARGRVYILTGKGAVGLAPHGCQPGDAIWILVGGNMPVLVRRLGSGFTLVGECYIHGIMNGEVLQDINIPVEEITLI